MCNLGLSPTVCHRGEQCSTKSAKGCTITK